VENIQKERRLLTWRLLIHPAFIIHSYYAFPSLYCRLPRKCETIFCSSLIRRTFANCNIAIRGKNGFCWSA